MDKDSGAGIEKMKCRCRDKKLSIFYALALCEALRIENSLSEETKKECMEHCT